MEAVLRWLVIWSIGLGSGMALVGLTDMLAARPIDPAVNVGTGAGIIASTAVNWLLWRRR